MRVYKNTLMKSWPLTSPTSLYTLFKYPTWLLGVNFLLLASSSFSKSFSLLVSGLGQNGLLKKSKLLPWTAPWYFLSLMPLYVLEGLHFISSWTKSSSGSASLFGWPLAAAWRGRFSPVWHKVFHTFETVTPLTLYVDDLWSYRSKTSWVVLCWNIPASTQNIINNQRPHACILFNWFPAVHLPYAFFWGKVVLPAKSNIMSLDQSERSKWSREQVQNVILHIFFS